MSPSDANPVKSSSPPANTTQDDQALPRMLSDEGRKITAPSRPIEV
jgi:hypothetical protein